MTQHEFDALLLDFDGVLRRWPPVGMLGEVPEEAVLSAAFSPDLLHQAVTGRLDDVSWRRLVAERLSSNFGRESADAAVAAWSAPCGEVDGATLDVIERVRSSMPVVLVTNATSCLDDDLRRLGLSDYFTHVINSSAIGCAKPDAAFFEYALAAVGVSASRALFVDDSPENVAAAERLGITSHLFESATAFADFLASPSV